MHSIPSVIRIHEYSMGFGDSTRVSGRARAWTDLGAPIPGIVGSPGAVDTTDENLMPAPNAPAESTERRIGPVVTREDSRRSIIHKMRVLKENLPPANLRPGLNIQRAGWHNRPPSSAGFPQGLFFT